MRRASLACLVLGLVALGHGPARSQPQIGAPLGPPPACAGRDVFAEMKTGDPAAFAAIRKEADATANARSLLWRIEGKGQPASYLFGTVHVTDERVHKVSPATRSALDGAKKVALELAEIAAGAHAMAEAMARPEIVRLVIFDDGKSLADYLSEGELRKLREVFAKIGLPADSAQIFRPWFAWMLLVLPPCETLRGAAGLSFLDERIGRDAVKGGKSVVGLETILAQFQSLAGVPLATQVQLLKSSLALIADQENHFEVMIRLYLNRDMGVFFPFFYKTAEKAGFNRSGLVPMERELVDKRNVVMRDAALPHLRQGSTFIAVGAAHLIGKGGLVELFRAAGYRLTAVD